MQKQTDSRRRVAARVVRDPSRAQARIPHLIDRSTQWLRERGSGIRLRAAHRVQPVGAIPIAGTATRGRWRRRFDPIGFWRSYLAPVAAQRRGPTILAVLLLAFASVLTQFPSTGLGAPGGTGGTYGAGQAFNPRIAALNSAADTQSGGSGTSAQVGQIPSQDQVGLSAQQGQAVAAGLPGMGSGPLLAGYGAGGGAAAGSSGAVAGTDGAGPGAVDTSGGTVSPSPSPGDVSGQFGVDGSLIKPFAVDTSVPDISGQVRIYTVQSGDTLTGIASRFGLSMMTIWWANNLTSADELHIGQKLRIPPTDGVLYTVKQGDTLTSIAKQFDAKPADIMSYNGLQDATVIIGQQLMIPGGHGAPIPTPAPQPVQVAQSGSGNSGGSSGPAGTPYVGNVPAYGGEAVFGSCATCPFHGQMTWPVPGGYISQYFWWGHPAIDIAAPMGSSILAAYPGVVTFAGWRNNGGGYQIWVSHGQNVYTTYNHLSSILIGAGAHVSAGQLIGRVGMTGDATGPHCHFEVWIGPIWDGGYRVNPLDFVHR